MLPAGPKWKLQVLPTDCPTKSPVRLFFRDPLECLESIFSHPRFAKHMDYVPRRVYKTAEKLVRVYNEWMTGDAAWKMQVSALLISVFPCPTENSKGAHPSRCYFAGYRPVL
jgi:hypothetical protein